MRNDVSGFIGYDCFSENKLMSLGIYKLIFVCFYGDVFYICCGKWVRSNLSFIFFILFQRKDKEKKRKKKKIVSCCYQAFNSSFMKKVLTFTFASVSFLTIAWNYINKKQINKNEEENNKGNLK